MAQNLMNKGKRAPNFTVREKTLLLNIIHNYKHIIENKQTNVTTWREKDLTWSKIAAEFNSQNEETYRTKEHLKKYYDNIKKTVRKEVAEEKKELNKTGGGIFIIKTDPIKDLTLDLINKKTVYGFQNSFDGDSTQYTLENADVLMEEYNESKEQEGNDEGFLKEHSYTKEENTNLEAHVLAESATNLIKLVPNECSPGFSGHVSHPKTPSLRNTWTKRRRPTPQVQSTALENENIETAKAKIKCFKQELINIEARRQQDKELFELQKEKLLLEIKIKQQELNKLLINRSQES